MCWLKVLVTREKTGEQFESSLAVKLKGFNRHKDMLSGCSVPTHHMLKAETMLVHPVIAL